MHDLPPVVRIEPAASCNLRCLHCPTGLGESPRGLMSMDTFEKILVDLKLYKDQVKTVVLYHGGEPLLNANLGKMIEGVRKCEIPKIKVVSNGKLLNEDISKELVKSGLNEIEFSLDSVGITESDGIRRRSRAYETVQSIKALMELINTSNSFLKISISTTQFVDDYNINEVKNLKIAPKPQWIIDLFPDLEIKSTWAVQWPGGFPNNQKIAFQEIRMRQPSSCSLLNETITVRSNGEVVVCCYDLTGLSSLGNISQNSLSWIWKSKTYSDFRNNFENGIFPEPCKSCAVVTGARYLSRTNLIAD
jgi:radical SAM protein with 4Fe4S-binding SPASM domain